MWSEVILTYFDPIVTLNEINMVFTISATQPDIGETETTDITSKLTSSIDSALTIHNDTMEVLLFTMDNVTMDAGFTLYFDIPVHYVTGVKVLYSI